MNTKLTKTLMAAFFLLVAWTPDLLAQNQITVSGDSGTNSISAETATVVAPNLTINSSGNITDFTVSITNSFTAADQLGYNGALPAGVTTSGWNSEERSIVFKGTLTATQWQSFLRNVTITSGPICNPETRQVSFVAEETFYNPLNEHFYRLTNATSNWTSAKSTTSSTSYFGLEGYLVTLTSNAENIFVTRIIGQDSWMGASDDHEQINEALGYELYADTNASEGKFYWVTGPEKGTQITTDNGNGNAVPGVFQNWRSGEPNDYQNGNPGESFGHVYTSRGDWNDYDNNHSILGIMEFGGMPNDQTTSTPVFTKDIAISGAPGGTITGGEVSVCAGSNSTTLTLNGLDGTVVRWESSDNNFIDTPTIISNASTTLTVNNISTTTYYRAVVNTNSPTSCTDLVTSSTPIYVLQANAGNVFAENTTICAGSNVELIVSGQNGDVEKWQRSTDNVNWTDIANTSTTLDETIASTGTYYYRVVVGISDCGSSATSSAKEITVVAGTPPVGGEVSSASHTSTTNSGTLTLTGYTGNISKWQMSTDDGIIWTDITNISDTYNYTNITTDTKFRVILVNGSCGTAYSDEGLISVAQNEAPTASPVSFSGTLVEGNTLSGSYTYNDADGDTENGTTYQWYRSDDGTGTNKMAISGANGQTYNLTADDINKYISFSVVPGDGSSTGSETESTLQGPIKADSDLDGIPDETDNCALIANADQLDTDSDGQGNVCDNDDDNDDTPDVDDAFPLDDSENTDTDGDGIGDNADEDDDNDGTPDSEDAFPKDDSENTDTDGDGIGDNADEDDDNDGTPDSEDAFPKDDSEDTDTDGDGIGDNVDQDDDNDGTPDSEDAFPKDNSEDTDTDGDGIGDNVDEDDDGDGTPDDEDDFPLDPYEDTDTDGDGIGDNADDDADDDGVADVDDAFPTDKEPSLVPAQAFTPNGDGNNDAWVIPGIDNYPNNVVHVYNRWGHEVFGTKSYRNNWEGFYKNRSEKLPPGSYMYVIDLGDGSAPLQGWIFINY
nr:gliding motility-associated C-terminal domain-containing protein [uncultured Allomuricauda sp.]